MIRNEELGIRNFASSIPDCSDNSSLLTPHSSLLIAMSGGVDSSVSAFLMTQKYKSCKGATMLLFLNEALGISSRHPCCSLDNIRDAKKICELLGIEHEVLNFMADFEDRVIKKFVSVYETGGTPNPCIDCNRFMKFDMLLRDSPRVATGHYAKIERDSSGRYLLYKAKDSARDQSYVLYMLTQEQLSRVEFPLGDMKKSEVRDLAEELNFINARKHDSQDICFVPDGDYGKFIESYTGKEYPAGNFVDTSGKILGTHKGIIHYTAGQRRGLGVAAKSRLYVSKIDGASNTITLASEGEEILYCNRLRATGVNLIAFDKLPPNFRASVKTRYRQKEIPAVINQVADDEMIIEFQTPQKVPAYGQAAVIYDGDLIIGGGTIAR